MRKLTLLILGLLICFLVATLVGFSHAAGNPLQRQTKFGIVEGLANEVTKTLVWRSVPFAKPPVGSLRWKAPQEPDQWKGVLDTKVDCEKCTQLRQSPGWISFPEVWGSEDCLYLNIFRPQTEEGNLPVYVWIHGGANTAGWAANYPMGNPGPPGQHGRGGLAVSPERFRFFHPSST